MTTLLNLASELLDRPILMGEGDRVVLRQSGSAGEGAMTLREVAIAVNRVAFVLRGMGVAGGDRFFVDLDRHPVALFASLAAARLGAIAILVPSDPAEATGLLGEAGGVVALTSSDRRGLFERARPSTLREIVIVDDHGGGANSRGGDWSARIAQARDQFTPVVTDPTDPVIAFDPHAPHGHELLAPLQEGIRRWLDPKLNAAWGITCSLSSPLGMIGLLGGLAHGVSLHIPARDAASTMNRSEPVHLDWILADVDLDVTAVAPDWRGSIARGAMGPLDPDASPPMAALAVGLPVCPMVIAGRVDREGGARLHPWVESLDVCVVDGEGAPTPANQEGVLEVEVNHPWVGQVGEASGRLRTSIEARRNEDGSLEIVTG